MMRHLRFSLLTTIFTTLFTANVSAQLIAYEPFDYAHETQVFGGFGDGGTGWLDSWQNRTGNFNPELFTAQRGGLTYTDASGNELTVEGNYVLADFNGFDPDEETEGGGNVQMYRDVLAEGTIGDLVGGPGNSYFISFIGERRGATNSESVGNSPHDPNEFSRNAHLSLTSARGNEEAQLGNPSNQTTDTWKIRAKDGPDADTGLQFSYSQSFVVTKVTVGDGTGEPGGDQIDMWINPRLNSEAAAGAPNASHVVLNDQSPYNMSHIGIGAYVGSQSGGRAGGVMAFDEIRIGHTWEDVTPFEGRGEGILGDFDGDDAVGLSDADLLVGAIASTENSLDFDLTSDGLVNADDLTTFLTGDLISTGNKLSGDADLNGSVEFADFLKLSANFGQDTAKWSAGDFDANGSVEFADFLILSQNFGQSSAALAAVPEPAGLSLALFGLLFLCFRSRR